MALDLTHAAQGGPNLAPAKALQPLIKPDKPATTDFHGWLLGTTQKLEKEHLTVWRELYYTWELIGHFMEGRQVLRRSNRTGRWRVAGGPKSTADPVQALPVLGFYSRALLAKWVQSRVRTQVIGIDDSDQAVYTAEAGNKILPWLEERIYTERFNQEECLNAQMSGCFARYAYYSPDADGGLVERQITEPQTLTMGQSIGYCADCGVTVEVPTPQSPGGAGATPTGAPPVSTSSGPVATAPTPSPQDSGMGVPGANPNSAPPMPGPQAASAPDQTCPNCGSPNFHVEQAPQVSIDAVVGTKQEKLGLPVGEQVPFFELRFDLALPLEKSPFLFRSRRLRKKVVEATYPGLKIDRGVNFDETGLESQARLKTATPLGGRGYTPDSAIEDETCTFKQWWFDPCMYQSYICREDIQTVSGQTIPANTPFKDVFPDGMYVAFVPGTDKILEVFNEHHRDHWVSSPYHVKLMSGMGYGIHEALEAQRQSNLLYNQVWTKARSSATPGIAYDASVFSPDVARDLGQPQKNLPANTGHLADNKRLQDALFPIPAGSFGQELIWYSNELRSVMQLSSGAIDFAQGIPGIQNNTATGAQLGASLANLQQEPVLALRAEANERFGMILLKLWQKYCHDQRYVSVKGNQGELEGKYFSSADLSAAFIVKAQPGSWKTQSDAEARDNFRQALQALQMAGPGAPATLVRQIGDVYNVDLAFSPYKDQARLCRIRIEQMKAQLGPAQQQAASIGQQMAMQQQMGIPVMGDPEAIVGQQLTQYINPKISPFEPGHKESWEWLQSWMLRDEGIDAPNILRYAIISMIEQHMQAAVQFQMLYQQIQSPLQMMMQAQQPQQPQPQPSANERVKQKAQPNMSSPKPGQSNNQNGPPKQPHPVPGKAVPQPGGVA